jgi:hypothetical protein
MAIRHHEPVYRPILREAFKLTWEEKKLWLLSAIAGILLTGSVYDVVFKGFTAVNAGRGSSLLGTLAAAWGGLAASWPGLTISDIIFGSLNALLFTGFCLIIAFTIFAASVIAQGTIVYAIGARRRGRIPGFRDALTVGARALWPVLVLNIIAFAVLFATRGLIAVAHNALNVNIGGLLFLVYLLSFVVFVIVGGVTVIIQIFALNAMILQGATLAQGIERGIEIFRRHWVVTIETVAILFVISIGASILTITLLMLLTIPYFILGVTAIAVKSALLWTIVTLLFFLASFLVVLGVFGFVIQLHYTSWTLMYRKLGEGGVLPKLHRLARAFIHRTSVPGA